VVCGYFRMAIDRAFNLKGVGLIVTGMIFSGTVHNGQSLMLLSNGASVRVREIRVHNQVRASAKAGERCALSIVGRGLGEKSIKRGTWLAHSDLNVPTKRMDVNLKVLKTETKTLDPNTLTYWIRSFASKGCSFVWWKHFPRGKWFSSTGSAS
jgi:selenocysteine-specific elongation factor